jgi:adenylate cyclase
MDPVGVLGRQAIIGGVIVALSLVAVAEFAGLIALGVVLLVTRRRLVTTRRALERSRESRSSDRRRRGPVAVAPLAVRAVAHTVRTADAVVRKQIGGVRSAIEDLAGWARVEQPDLARITADGRVVLMFSDIEGSTQLNESLGDRRWVEILERHNALIGRCVADHHGYLVKNQGDGFMVAFAEPLDAVRCCVAVQSALHDDPERWPDIRVRMGAHVGTSVRRGDDLFGRNVALAARVAALAAGGEVLVSDDLHEAVDGDASVAFGDPRDVELKGFDGRRRVYPIDLKLR